MNREYEKRLFEEKTKRFGQSLEIVDNLLGSLTFEYSEEKQKHAFSLATNYRSRIEEKMPEVLIIGILLVDKYHGTVGGSLIYHSKPKCVLVEDFNEMTEEEVENYIKYFFSEKSRRDFLIFLESLPDVIQRNLGSENRQRIVKSHRYVRLVDLQRLFPIILCAKYVGAKIVGCDDPIAKHFFFEELASILFEKEGTDIKNLKEYMGRMEKYSRQREETMANRILEYLNKIDERERREMIRNYRVPVIAIIGRDHTNNVAQKLRERGVKVEVINLEPIEDEKELTRQWEVYVISRSISSYLWSLLDQYIELYDKFATIDL